MFLEIYPEKINTLASRRNTRSNPDPDPPTIFENPNLIPRTLRKQGSQESSEREIQVSFGSSRLLSRSASCPVKIIYVDEIPFDARFETSLFVNFSETKLSRLVLDPLFAEDLQYRFVSYHLDRQLQNSVVATNTPEFTESASQTLGPSEFASSSRIPTEPPFIPTIPVQPEFSD